MHEVGDPENLQITSRQSGIKITMYDSRCSLLLGRQHIGPKRCASINRWNPETAKCQVHRGTQQAEIVGVHHTMRKANLSKLA